MKQIATCHVMAAVGILLWVGACGSDANNATVAPPEGDVKTPSDSGQAKDTNETTDTFDTGPDVQQPPADPARLPRRMTIQQLARSIPVITGGIEWIEDFGNGPMDMLQILAPTLGAPDYLLVTEENLEPSLIIAKFMQDASNRICTRWIDDDRKRPVEERNFVRHDDWDSLDDADVKKTLRALVFRVFSRFVAPDDDAPISDLNDLFLAASGAAPSTQKARDGWLAVCLALMTDPEFVLY